MPDVIANKLDHLLILTSGTEQYLITCTNKKYKFLLTTTLTISGFKISYINSNDKDIIPVFILNSDNTICKDPFFYRCDGGLCFDYLKACEEKYRTNVTESIEEK